MRGRLGSSALRISVAAGTGTSVGFIRPDSIFDRSSRSVTSRSRRVASWRHICRISRWRSVALPASCSCSSWMPICSVFSGVRSSCDAMPTNSVFSRSASRSMRAESTNASANPTATKAPATTTVIISARWVTRCASGGLAQHRGLVELEQAVQVVAQMMEQRLELV